MPGIISGYEYDIFISYRQNDNRYDNWVSDFVADLTRELEATIKEKLRIYQDKNTETPWVYRDAEKMKDNQFLDWFILFE